VTSREAGPNMARKESVPMNDYHERVFHCRYVIIDDRAFDGETALSDERRHNVLVVIDEFNS
jgi:hypothetical protein